MFCLLGGFRPIQDTSIKQGGTAPPALEVLVGHAGSRADFLTAVGEIHPAGGRLHLFLVVMVCHAEINWRQRWPLVAAAGSRRTPRLRAQPHRHRAGTTSVGSCVGTNERPGEGDGNIRDVYARTHYKHSFSPRFQSVLPLEILKHYPSSVLFPVSETFSVQ